MIAPRTEVTHSLCAAGTDAKRSVVIRFGKMLCLNITCWTALHVGLLTDPIPPDLLVVWRSPEEQQEAVQIFKASVDWSSSDCPPA